MELLRGLMDTDGFVEKRGQCEFVQKNKRIVDDFSELLSSLGIKHTVREKQAKCNGKDAGVVYSVLFTPIKQILVSSQRERSLGLRESSHRECKE